MLETLIETQRVLVTAVVFVLVFFGAILIGRLLKRRAGVRLGLLYQMFALALAVYAAVSIYDPRTIWRGHAGALVVLSSTAFFIALFNRYVWDYYYETAARGGDPAAAAAVHRLDHFPRGAAAGAEHRLSRANAADRSARRLGRGGDHPRLRHAELLSTLVAGAELQIGKPYKLGDWLKIGDHIGQVMEINWADTRLRTNDAISIEIPNNKIVEDTIINLSFPTSLHAQRLIVGADYNVPPNRVKDALTAAATHAEGIVLDPPPKVFLKDFGDSAILYEVKFWMNSHATYNDLCDAIRTNIWYEFRRQKINIPFPIRTLQMERKPTRSCQRRGKREGGVAQGTALSMPERRTDRRSPERRGGKPVRTRRSSDRRRN
jgi:small-conductance mechanosensitive channel